MTTHPNPPFIDPHLLAMFVWQGFLQARPWGQADADLYGGQIGAAVELSDCVTELHQALNRRLTDVVMPGFPGVMDYEVSEPFGAWCRQNFHCNPRDRRAQAKRLVDRFFDQGMIKR
ncbi:hypothetical protein D3C87_358600 [compost metagenome]